MSVCQNRTYADHCDHGDRRFDEQGAFKYRHSNGIDSSCYQVHGNQGTKIKITEYRLCLRQPWEGIFPDQGTRQYDRTEVLLKK